jgi:bacterioferritin B
MISQQASKLLVAQIAHELNAHQLYMGISLSFERQSLKGWSKLFHDQAVEEAGHAGKIMAFLIDNEVEFAMPAVRTAPTTYASARAAVEAALASEQKVSALFETMVNTCRDAQDNRSLQFLWWFVEEQVEEERTARALLDLIDSGINLFQAESMLDGIVG